MAVEVIWQHKALRVNGGAASVVNTTGIEHSMWQYDGTPGPGGATPTTWANPDRTTPGALGQANPPAGLQRWLSTIGMFGAASAGLRTLYDRLGHMGGMSGVSTSLQNVNGGADGTVTRTYKDPSGKAHIGNEIWLENYVTIGVTQQTATVVYKNENGTSRTATVLFGGGNTLVTARLAQEVQRVPLVSGDRGVSAVVSVTLGGSTGTAGNFGVTIVHPLLVLVPGAGSPEFYSGAIEGDIEILTDACLFWGHMPTLALSATVPAVYDCLVFVDK